MPARCDVQQVVKIKKIANEEVLHGTLVRKRTVESAMNLAFRTMAEQEATFFVVLAYAPHRESCLAGEAMRNQIVAV